MISRQAEFENSQREWLASAFDALTSSILYISPSEWAEQNRYLPPAVTPLPGLFSFDVTPFMREILDCLGVDSPIRELALMKGAQICATTAILENIIGYFIDHIKTSPLMMVTADADLAQLRMTSYITPMLQESGLIDSIRSADETNKRKRGKTDKKLEWIGGGSLVPFGAQNANKFRSITAQVLLNDEVDGWPDTVGGDGDPVELIRARAKAYESTRKVLDLSTPLIKGQSKIQKLFERGDQRYYNVKCLECRVPQVLRWSRNNTETGELTGIVWETDDKDRLVPGSVRYRCKECGHPHTENDKPRLFGPENAEWVPTADPVAPDIRSYHLSALYSPVGMQSWESCVRAWLEAWDVDKSRPRDMGKLQVFYNNILGEVFELRGEKLRLENVSAHRRSYRWGEIPNEFATEFSGGPIQLLICTVDVHQDNLKVAVIGWCRDRRAYLIDYETFAGDPSQLDDPGTWGKLRPLIESKEWIADDAKRYGATLTLIDSGYMQDVVTRFCAEYQQGVFPVKGRATAPKSTRTPEFSDFTTPNGVIAYGVTVDLYKDRWSAALRRSWDGMGLQPNGHFNAPLDITDKQLKELTVEVKREKIEKSTGKRIGVEWHRPSGAANELWDLLIYSACGLDLLAWNLSKMAELEFTNWQAFWDVCESGRFYNKD